MELAAKMILLLGNLMLLLSYPHMTSTTSHDHNEGLDVRKYLNGGHHRVTVRCRPLTALSVMFSHIDQIQTMFGSHLRFSTPSSHTLFTGFFVYGLDIQTLSAFADNFDYVISIQPSRKLKCAEESRNWGLARLNSLTNPASSNFTYSVEFKGEGVDVYVIDSGIDTTHSEFNGNKIRRVLNVFDINYGMGQLIPTNNDKVGHGTHCAGIIGGQTVGVASSANVYGVKVMDDSGEGYDSDIIEGLKFVYDAYLAHKWQPTVVSMSIGGPCGSYDDCSVDLLVQAVEMMTTAGMVVVVAAGNGKCDACLETPAFAPSAITVGAIDRADRAAVFSDFGKCVDIYAPGVGITSACASALCGVKDAFVNMSGTSMACPFVSGVLAQIFEAHPGISGKQAESTLGCLAISGVLDVVQDETPSTTRNFLLQSPRASNSHTYNCDLGAGCANNCSGHGVCVQGQCFCDTNWWGDSCHASEFGRHCSDGFIFIEYSLYDTRSLEWTGAAFRIFERTGHPDGGGGEVGVMSSSMCGARNESSGVCLRKETSYGVSLTGDATNSAHIGYSICQGSGGAPSSQQLYIDTTGACLFVCPTKMRYFNLEQSAYSGWKNGCFTILNSQNAAVLQGGTLAGLGTRETHPVCLREPHESVMVLVSRSTSGGGVWSFCGHSGTSVDDFALYNMTHGCSYLSALRPSAGSNEFAIGEFDLLGQGWGVVGRVDVKVNISSSISAYDDSKSIIVSSAYLNKGAATGQMAYKVPLSSDYWHIDGTSSGPIREEKFWISCGYRGFLGEQLRFRRSLSPADTHGCTRDCLTLQRRNKLRQGDFNLLTVLGTGPGFPLQSVLTVSESSLNLCLGNASRPAEPSCYRALFGAGSLLSGANWTLCDTSFPSVAVIDVCVRDWVQCEASVIYAPGCSRREQSALLLVMYSELGLGWGDSEFILFDIRTLIEAMAGSVSVNYTPDSDDGSQNSTGPGYIVRGTLASGYTGYDSFCLSDGCYALMVTPGNQSDSIASILCGHVGNVGEMFFFQIKGGRCLVVSNPLQCEIDALAAGIRRVYMYFEAIMSIIFVGMLVFVFRFCCKTSGLYRPRNEQRTHHALLQEEGLSSWFSGLSAGLRANAGYTPVPTSTSAETADPGRSDE